MSTSNYAILDCDLEWYLISSFVQKKLQANYRMLSMSPLRFQRDMNMDFGHALGAMFSSILEPMRHANVACIDDFYKYASSGLIAHEPLNLINQVIVADNSSANGLPFDLSFRIGIKGGAKLITQGHGYVAVHSDATRLSLVDKIFKKACAYIKPRIIDSIAKIENVIETEFGTRDYDSREYIVYATRSKQYLREQIEHLQIFLETSETQDAEKKLRFIEATLQIISATKKDQPYNVAWADTNDKFFNVPVSLMSAWSRENIREGFVERDWSVWDDEFGGEVKFHAKYVVPRCASTQHRGWGSNAKVEAEIVTYGREHEEELDIPSLISKALKESETNLLANAASETNSKLNKSLTVVVDNVERIAREFCIYELMSKMFMQQTQIVQLHQRLVGGGQVLSGGMF